MESQCSKQNGGRGSIVTGWLNDRQSHVCGRCILGLGGT